MSCTRVNSSGCGQPLPLLKFLICRVAAGHFVLSQPRCLLIPSVILRVALTKESFTATNGVLPK
jgi:hypothetical protein